MIFSELAKKRRSVHSFIPNKEFTDAQFKELIKTTSYTPSGYNAQPWEFVLIRDKDRLKKLQEIAYNQKHITECSGVIVILGDTNIGRNADELLKDWVKYGYCTEEQVPVYKNTFTKKRAPEKLKDMSLRNATLSAMTLMYAAEEMGLATCPMMGITQWELMDFIKAPEDRILIMAIAIGYEDTGKEKPQLPRKKIENMIHFEEFS